MQKKPDFLTGLAENLESVKLLRYIHTFWQKKQVKPGFTNYQPRGLDNQIKFEV